MKHQTCYQTVHQHILEIMPKIRKPAVGKFVAPYLTVTWGAFYANIFGWDNHHMTLRFAAEGEPCEMKYYLQNMLEFQEPDGFISNCMNDKGPCGKSRGPFHAQPFLAQNAAIFCSISNDVEFIKTIYPKLEKYLDYYFREMHSENGLYSWYYPYMSGIDNEICASVFPPGTILSVDLNSYLIMECRAMAYLAEKIGMEPAKFRTKAEQMTDSVNQYLWDENYGSYGNYNTVQKRVQFDYGADPLPGDTGKYCFMSCVGFPVLFAGVATPERAERMIRTYLMSPEHFLSNYGLRSISGKSEFYGNCSACSHVTGKPDGISGGVPVLRNTGRIERFYRILNLTKAVQRSKLRSDIRRKNYYVVPDLQ